jgi:hypothetical protein
MTERNIPSNPIRYRIQQDKGEYCLKGCDDGDLVDWGEYAVLQREIERQDKLIAEHCQAAFEMGKAAGAQHMEIERLRALLEEWAKGCPNPPEWHWAVDLYQGKLKPSVCPFCWETPKVGRTVHRTPGKSAGGWIVFCEASQHYIEVTAKTRIAALRLWEDLRRPDNG